MANFLRAAECAVCKEALNQSELILTNPCGHLLCAECACQFSRMWQDGAEPELRCTVCRTTQVEHKPLWALVITFTAPLALRWYQGTWGITAAGVCSVIHYGRSILVVAVCCVPLPAPISFYFLFFFYFFLNKFDPTLVVVIGLDPPPAATSG